MEDRTEYFQDWRKRHPEKVADYNRKRKYGMNIGDYDLFYEAQGGECLICHKKDKLVVDHEHSSGVVRGLICQSCNLSVAYLESFLENPDILDKLADYLNLSRLYENHTSVEL